jgi:hypothetical protein
MQVKELKQLLPALFKYFSDNNNVMNALKPDSTQYNIFEENHPEKCIIFIDDQQNNIDTAQKTANKRFKGILFYSPEQVRSKLE